MYACTYGRDSFTSSFLTCMPFISFLALLRWPGFSTLCWIRVVRVDRHACLFLILGGSVQSSNIKYNVSCRLFVMVLIKLRKFLIFWVFFFSLMHVCWIFSNVFLKFYDHVKFLLWAVYMSYIGFWIQNQPWFCIFWPMSLINIDNSKQNFRKLYWFSIAAITNYHKLSDLKRQKLILL